MSHSSPLPQPRLVAVVRLMVVASLAFCLPALVAARGQQQAPSRGGLGQTISSSSSSRSSRSMRSTGTSTPRSTRAVASPQLAATATIVACNDNHGCCELLSGSCCTAGGVSICVTLDSDNCMDGQPYVKFSNGAESFCAVHNSTDSSGSWYQYVFASNSGASGTASFTPVAAAPGFHELCYTDYNLNAGDETCCCYADGTGYEDDDDSQDHGICCQCSYNRRVCTNFNTEDCFGEPALVAFWKNGHDFTMCMAANPTEGEGSYWIPFTLHTGTWVDQFRFVVQS